MARQMGDHIVSVGRLHATDDADVLESTLFVSHCGHALAITFPSLKCTVFGTSLLVPCYIPGVEVLVAVAALRTSSYHGFEDWVVREECQVVQQPALAFLALVRCEEFFLKPLSEASRCQLRVQQLQALLYALDSLSLVKDGQAMWPLEFVSLFEPLSFEFLFAALFEG